MTENPVPAASPAPSDDSLKTFAMAVYGLMAASLLTGGLAAIAALILAHMKCDDARSTWLGSHFTWQIRSLWWTLGWTVLGVLTVAFIIGWFIILGATVWYVYRIVRGFVRFSERRPAY